MRRLFVLINWGTKSLVDERVIENEEIQRNQTWYEQDQLNKNDDQSGSATIQREKKLAFSSFETMLSLSVQGMGIQKEEEGD